jgi:hypothetical protein
MTPTVDPLTSMLEVLDLLKYTFYLAPPPVPPDLEEEVYAGALRRQDTGKDIETDMRLELRSVWATW